MPPRIKVAFPFVGDELGGSHISAIQLICALDRKRFDPVVILHREQGPVRDFLQEHSLSVIAAPDVAIYSPRDKLGTAGRIRRGLGFIATTSRLAGLLRRLNAHIVHTNDGQMHATWAFAAQLAGAKLVWHHRGDPTACGVNKVAPLLAHHIVTVSNFGKPKNPIFPVDHKLSVIYSPFAHPRTLPLRDFCRRQFINELGLAEETRFVGYVGSLIDRKRPVRFVEIIYAFLQQHPGFPLVGLIFGSPAPNLRNPEADIRSRATELGVSDKICMMGFRAPVDPCISALEALLVPAVNEPFGRTLIESMLLKTPVVATRHGGNIEAIEDGVTGFLVQPEAPAAFIPPLEKILFDKDEWQRISSAAFDNARLKYGTEVHVADISMLYEQLSRRGG
ncbi:glycosyltransferase family 4 protein [Sinorhizobium sp. NFACC03]|uniref:glycosyltransferase family 4 protein n=1 Tax=Sinorhizobium sp. NFACC03 TaxID=1566295 RepID=UPI000885E24A|nr:glycosyltransferase family 4 protein [Sinorhizobium sp. NFACC03]SDA92792.1 Glycosyltransferase involved in cell wall bisynthesis [Sinorhizobium sp. NFACC03]